MHLKALNKLYTLDPKPEDSGNPGRCAGAALGVCELMRAGGAGNGV